MAPAPGQRPRRAYLVADSTEARVGNVPSERRGEAWVEALRTPSGDDVPHHAKKRIPRAGVARLALELKERLSTRERADAA